ncbi:MAG TPA: LptE family protein [Vicinamibacteria bacterium]|nr:LptE family protein [Vicinamibacteria bacterium]
MTRKKSLLLVTTGSWMMMGMGCGYSLAGRGNYLPDYISVIAVPTFANNTDRVAVEELFTRKVVEEFNSRGRYRIQGDVEGADAVMEGTVLSLTAVPSVLEGGDPEDPQSNQASTYTVVVRAQVAFRDLVEDKVIWSSGGFQFRDDFEIGENPDEFFDQEGLTLERLAEEFAKSLVSSILEAF